jgi:hypothetical protein
MDEKECKIRSFKVCTLHAIFLRYLLLVIPRNQVSILFADDLVLGAVTGID